MFAGKKNLREITYFNANCNSTLDTLAEFGVFSLLPTVYHYTILMLSFTNFSNCFNTAQYSIGIEIISTSFY